MFVYDKEKHSDINVFRLSDDNGYKELSRTTESEDDLFELMKTNNPFINREIAKNPNLTLAVMKELLTEKHVAYTMCVILANNKNITDEIKKTLYSISDNLYKDSMLREDLDSVFKEP